VRPVDLYALPILSNSPPAPMHRQIMRWFQTAGLEPQRLSICNSVTVIAHLVTAGVAVGLLPRKMIESDVAAGNLEVLVARPAIEPAQLFAAHRAGEADRPMTTVIRASRAVLDELDFLQPL
jgi:DNA-binding transcriptional LysR family regulator